MRTGLLAILACLATACADVRDVSIRTVPPDADIRINGQPDGRAPINERFVFRSATDQYKITASRAGYRDQTETITRDETRPVITMELRPQSKRINIRVEPAPAIVKIDGIPLSIDPVSTISAEPEFGLDLRGQPVKHTITAERDNFAAAERVITFSDPDLVYLLRMELMKKTVTIITDPLSADVFLDNRRLGISPLTVNDLPFPVDLESNNFITKNLRASLPGYEAAEMPMSWDGGKTTYAMKLGLRQKEVHLTVDPPDAIVKIDGLVAPVDKSGNVSKLLSFAPTNTRGDLQTYGIDISKKTEDIEYEPKLFNIGWDNGQVDYRVSLKEIPAKPMPVLSVALRRNSQGWQIVPEVSESYSFRDISEMKGRPQAQPVLRLPRDVQLGSLALSPDGSKIVYTQVSGTSREELRSQMFVVSSAGQKSPQPITDGKSIDAMPAFTPNGDQIIFSSNRGGKRMNIWAIPVTGGEPQRLTTSDSNDLWPAVDRDPKPRLFYQAMIDTRADSLLYIIPNGSTYPVDLTQPGGMQPRVGPRNDAILFAAVDSKSNLRDIFRASDTGSGIANLTNTPQADEYDASWSREGAHVVFASNRSTDSLGRKNFDIWMIEMAHPEQAIQITTNGSLDDCPVFDVLGDAVYFRSNRGGQWGIWKISLK